MKTRAPRKKAAEKLTAASKGVAKKSNFKGVTWHSYNRRWRSSLPIGALFSSTPFYPLIFLGLGGFKLTLGQ